MEKEEKKDNTKEQSVKKTPKSKPSTSGSSQDKMMELMLASMSSVTEKFSRDGGTYYGFDRNLMTLYKNPPVVANLVHVRSRRKCESSDERQNILTTHSVIQSDTGVAYSKSVPGHGCSIKTHSHTCQSEENSRMTLIWE